VVSFDPADETKAVVGELILRNLDHRVDRVVILVVTVRIQVRSVLGPDLRNDLATPPVVTLVPRSDVTDDQFVDVLHGTLLPLFVCRVVRPLPTYGVRRGPAMISEVMTRALMSFNTCIYMFLEMEP